jgi:membrane protease YdiL (CAAX protease family)
MEELLANANDHTLSIFNMISHSLLFGGLLVAIFVIALHRRHPPQREKLTAQIAARSWNIPMMVGILVLFCLLYLLASYARTFFYDFQMPLFKMVALLLIYLTILSTIGIINHVRGNSWAGTYGLGLRQTKTLLYSPLLYLAIIPFLLLSSQLYNFILEKIFGGEAELQAVATFIAHERSWLQILYILVAIIAAPIYEEIIFRGMLFPYFTKRTGLLGGVVLTSAVFALIHLHTPSIVPLFLLSTGLCLAYWRSGSLWISIGIHALYNAVSVFALNLVG